LRLDYDDLENPGMAGVFWFQEKPPLLTNLIVWPTEVRHGQIVGEALHGVPTKST
jgi:hypothetical protein